MKTIKKRSFWPYSYILWKEVYRNIYCMCNILVANIIWRSGHAIPPSSLLDFPFLHKVASQFSVFSQLRNMIVLAARQMGTLSCFQIVLSMRKKWSRRTRQALRSMIPNFKYSYPPENAKRHRHLISLPSNFFLDLQSGSLDFEKGATLHCCKKFNKRFTTMCHPQIKNSMHELAIAIL